MKKILFGILTFLGIGLSFCSADGIYHNSTDGIISIVYNSGSNVITLSDKNLGATCSDITDVCSRGDFYQWGNNFGFKADSSNFSCDNNTFSLNLTNYGPGNYFNSNGVFYQKYQSDNLDLWGGITGTPTAMQGPCPEGYHIIDSWSNVLNILSSEFGLSSSLNLKNALLLSTRGEISASQCNYVSSTNSAAYWASTSNIEFEGNRVVVSDNVWTDSQVQRAGLNVRCFKDVSVSPDYTRDRIYGDVIVPVSQIDVIYNNGNSVSTVQCDGNNVIVIDGLSSIISGNTRTPYYNISYRDENNQSLIESYDHDNLYLIGQFKKTFTGDNDRILTSQGTCTDSDFNGYLPTFDVTGSINPTDTGNIFNNFAENSLKFTLSNIPSYIQYVIIIILLFLILGFIRKFKRK